MDIYDALRHLLKSKLTGAPVVDGDDVLLGMLEERDCLTVFVAGAACGCCGAAVRSATATVPLVASQTLFEDRRNQLDLRLSKVFKMGPKGRLRLNVDVCNVLKPVPSCRSIARSARDGNSPSGGAAPKPFNGGACSSSAVS